MNAYEKIKLVHTIVGAVALIAFWVAALSRKGGFVHRRAGKIYLVSLIGVMLSTLPFVVLSVILRRPSEVILLCYLLFVASTAAWLSWRSIRDKRDVKGYTGVFFRGLAIGVGLFGIAVLYLSTVTRSAPRALFLASLSTIGIIIGSNMLMLARSATADKHWWLSQHLNGAALNFAATHGSFVSIGLGSLVPALKGPWLVALSETGVLVIALVLRIWVGQRYFKPARSIQLLQRATSLLH